MIKAAIVGLGWWGRQIVTSFQGKSDRIRFIRGVDVDSGAARPFAEGMGFPVSTELRDALDDREVDAVFLATPHDLHEEQIIRAAGAGKHVFCEKPLCLTKAAAERAVSACEKAGVVLGVGHERRFEPAMIEIKRMIDAGELGTIMHVEANFSHDGLRGLPPDNWRVADPIMPPGMTAMGIHLTDSFIHMLGPVEHLYVQTARRVTGWPAGDVISVCLRFASGVTGYLNTVMVTPFFARFHVFGTDAWVEALDTVRPEVTGTVHFTVRRKGAEPMTRELPSIDCVVANIEAFVAAIAGTSPYPFSQAEKIGNVAVLDAVVQSVRCQLPVAVQ